MIRREYAVQLVSLLSGNTFEPEAISETYHYFVSDNLISGSKHYKLIWLLERGEPYIGVVNAYRWRK